MITAQLAVTAVRLKPGSYEPYIPERDLKVTLVFDEEGALTKLACHEAGKAKPIFEIGTNFQKVGHFNHVVTLDYEVLEEEVCLPAVTGAPELHDPVKRIFIGVPGGDLLYLHFSSSTPDSPTALGLGMLCGGSSVAVAHLSGGCH